MAQDSRKRPGQLEEVPLEKKDESILIDPGKAKFRDGQQGTDEQVEKLTRDYRRLLDQLKKHDRILKDYEVGDIQLPVKRLVMQDESGNPVVVKPNSDGTLTVIPFEEDVNYE